MTIREIFDESVRACMDAKITEDAHTMVLDTDIVPRKLFEEAIHMFEKWANNEDISKNKIYSLIHLAQCDAKYSAYMDCVDYLNDLLNELEGEENEDSD